MSDIHPLTTFGADCKDAGIPVMRLLPPLCGTWSSGKEYISERCPPSLRGVENKKTLQPDLVWTYTARHDWDDKSRREALIQNEG